MEQTEIKQPNSTICAISTPHGVGGIAIVRVSGPHAISVVQKIWEGKDLFSVQSHTVHLGYVKDTLNQTLDQALATVFRAPASYTAEDVVELSVHGSLWVQKELLSSLLKAGGEIASPGEFTQRAFAAGRFDLSQAEAVADIIASTSRASHKIAMEQMKGSVSTKLNQLRSTLVDLASLLELELDFSEEDVEFASREKLIDLASQTSIEIDRLIGSFKSGNAIKNGIPVAIIGSTNAGKSSLLNALLDEERAIVSSIHGTTRDIVEDTIEIGNYTIRFQDTAGIRHTQDQIEQIGIERSLSAAKKASIIINVVDATNPNYDIDPEIRQFDDKIITVLNKSDLVSIPSAVDTHINISAKTREGIAELKQILIKKINRLGGITDSHVMLSNIRHVQELNKAQEELQQLIQCLQHNIPTEFAAQHLRQTIYHIGAVTGQITTPEILNNIFSHFCIGK